MLILHYTYPIYQLRDWSTIAPLLRKGSQVLTVPLEIWQKLVDELKAPPSAGVLFLAWTIKILGDPSALTAAGFQVREPVQRDQQYHHALRHHKGSTRHHAASLACGARTATPVASPEGLRFLSE